MTFAIDECNSIRAQHESQIEQQDRQHTHTHAHKQTNLFMQMAYHIMHSIHFLIFQENRNGTSVENVASRMNWREGELRREKVVVTSAIVPNKLFVCDLLAAG